MTPGQWKRLREPVYRKTMLVVGILFGLGALGMLGMGVYTLITQREVPGAVTEVGGDPRDIRSGYRSPDIFRTAKPVKGTTNVVMVSFVSAVLMAILATLFLYLALRR